MDTLSHSHHFAIEALCHQPALLRAAIHLLGRRNPTEDVLRYPPPTSNSAPTAGPGCSASSSTVPAIIAHLPIPYRLVLQLADLDELSYKEVADDLQIPLGTVRARCLLRRHYCSPKRAKKRVK